MKTITVNGVEQIFLQFDNRCKKGNRILIYYSERAAQIIAVSTVLCLDGTFKYSPEIFYQIFTITSIYKCDYLQCVFMHLEKKNYETYLEALSQLRDGLYRNHNIVLGHLILILDFELAIQQALRQALHSNCVIKGCWFHFCHAILKHIGT